MNISSANTSGVYTSETNSSISPKQDNAVPDTSAQPGKAAPELGVTEEYVRKNLDRILKAVTSPETTVDRSVHEVTKQVIYKVKDKTSGEVIRQFPEEKLVEAAAKLIELTGMFVDKKV